MNKKILTTVLVATSLAYSGGTFAKGAHHDKHYDQPSHIKWAKVVDVQPITRTIEKRVPYEECWYETVAYETPGSSYDSHTGTILGGIIGGALGNAVGHKKKNKQIGTAVGAILGASIGHDISRGGARSDRHVAHRKERRCETQYDITHSEQTIGYDVWYRYHGERFHTRMDEHPGSKIRVRVDVSPI